MSIDRRKFINGVAAGFLTYDFLKVNVLKSVASIHHTFAGTRGALNPQADVDLTSILRRLGQPQLVIQLDPAAHPDDTIKPGQPISLSWAVYDPVSTFSTSLPRPSERYSSFQLTLFDRGNSIFGPTRQRRLSIPSSAMPRDFYRIDGRDRLITAELSDTAGAVASEGRFYMLVVWDNAPTWEWGAVPARNRWNRDHYTLTGTLRNNADFGNLTFHPILFQDEQIGSTPILDQTQAIPAAGPEHVLRPHDTRILPFPPIQQTWPWFDGVTLVQFQPFSRFFNYSVNITATDEFDNRYVGTSANRLISVDVEQSKLNEEALALAAMINAIISTFIGLIYPWAAALATAWWATVATLKAAALDPPEPDFDYFTLVRQEKTKPSDASPTMQLIGLVSQIANTPQILSEIESKLMGANLSNSSEGLALQQRSYVDAIRRINESAQQLVKVLPEAIQELLSRPEVNDENIQKARKAFSKGIPDDLLQTMRSAGLSKEAEIMCVSAMRNPEVMKQVPGIDTALTNVVKQAALLTLSLQYDMPKVLADKPKSPVTKGAN